MQETSKDTEKYISDTEKYISDTKININNYIRKNDYRKAFSLLILFLERLDSEDKSLVIDYYMQKIMNF